MPVSNPLPHAVAAVRDMDLLTPHRARLLSVAALVSVASLVTSLLILAAPHVGKWFGWDFACFWFASHFTLAGMPAETYVPSVFSASLAAVVLPNMHLPFLYPPPFLLITLPLALVPLPWSLTLFILATGAAFAAAIYLAAGSRWIMFGALACPAVLGNLYTGQNGMLTAALIGGGLTLMDRRPRLAGLILGLMVIKPQLVLALPFALVFSRRWTVLGYAALSAGALILLSLWLFGPATWTGFFAGTKESRYVLEDISQSHWVLQSAFSWIRLSGASLRLSYLAQILLFASGLALLLFARIGRVPPGTERALIVLVSLIGTPYLVNYDLVVIAFPLAWLLADWSQTRFPPWGKLALLAVYLAPAVPLLKMFAPSLPGYAWLCSTLIFLLYLLWIIRRPSAAPQS